MIEKTNLIFKNGSVYTVDKNRTWAQAIAIQDDKIVFVGRNEDTQHYIGTNTVVIDLDGKMVLPGFVDSHAHPSLAMDFVGNISLYLLDSVEEYKRAIEEYVADHTDAEAYRGGGWADTLFPNLGPPKEMLDAIVPNKPIAIMSYDCHSFWVNSVALERAQINKDTKDPEGGRIERDPETGQPSGTLRETASDLLKGVIPDYSIEERKEALLAYQEMAISAGITMSHDAMLDMQSIAAFRALAEEDRLKIRFRGAITLEPKQGIEGQIEAVLNESSTNDHPNFQVHTAKIFVDGVVEGGTAFLLEPYNQKPGFRGEPIWDPKKLNDACTALDQKDIQIHFHVIGDAAARITLDALEYAKMTNGRINSRHLVTHLQIVEPDDILRFKELGLIGVPQPFWFKIDDYYTKLALPYLGKERADRQYPMQSFIDAGVIMASGSDFPVTIPFDPLIAIQLGVTRSAISGKTGKVLFPEERVSLENMIRSYTYNGAYANFLEGKNGSIEVGKRADLIVLDQNLFEIPPDNISKTKVLLTLVDGIEVFRDPAFPRGNS
ncbi:MAG: amidohydrolase [Anaerolineales bacterium]|nr:amidohydrolase [Anaerolineales bacterium]MCK5646290.1 amidohydrolase [Anaerolineales bacterium]